MKNMDLELLAIERLKAAAGMSERLFKMPLVITYSGGKDSDVLLHLAEKSGIKYEVLHSLTTADAPETIYHIRDTFHRLEQKSIKCTVDKHRNEDGSHTTMWNLIPRNLMPPTRLVRYCCSELKESGGKGRFIATGVRWAESTARKKNRGALEVLPSKKENRLILNNDNEEDRRLFETCQFKGKRVVNPIVDWSDEDVLGYAEAEHIVLNPLYCEGFKRIGCIGCPIAGQKGRKAEFRRWPKYKLMYIRAFDQMLNEREKRRFSTMLNEREKRRFSEASIITEWQTGEDVFHWWMEDGVMAGQTYFEGFGEDDLV